MPEETPFDITIEIIGEEEIQANLDPKLWEAALNAALNKAAAKLKSWAKKAIFEIYNMKAGEIAQFIRITEKAKKGSSFVVIEAIGGYRPNLIHFTTKRVRDKGMKRLKRKSKSLRGVKVKVKKGGVKKRLTQAFVKESKFGGYSVFVRDETNNDKIVSLGTVRIADAFRAVSVELIKKLVEEEFGKLLNHEIDWRLQRNRSKRNIVSKK